VSIDKLTDEQVHIALLEAMGWRHQVEQHDRPAACGPGIISYDSWYSPDGEYMSASFELVKENFPLDYNLIAEAQKVLLRKCLLLWNKYEDACVDELDSPSSWLMLFCQLTPVQYARALLKAIDASL